MASLVISCGSWVLFGSLRFNKFYRTNHREALLRVDQKKSIKEEVRKLSVVFKKTWRLQICILYTLTVTITVFPGLQLGIEPQVCYDSGVNISSPPPYCPRLKLNISPLTILRCFRSGQSKARFPNSAVLCRHSGFPGVKHGGHAGEFCVLKVETSGSSSHMDLRRASDSLRSLHYVLQLQTACPSDAGGFPS